MSVERRILHMSVSLTCSGENRKQWTILTWKANAHQANEGQKFWATLGNKLMISRNTSNTPMFQYWLFLLNHNMYACNDCFHCAFSNLSFTCVHSDALCIFIPLMMAINWGTTQVWGQKYDWRTFVQAALANAHFSHIRPSRELKESR